MSKKETNQPTKVKWYKKPQLPWIIILTVVLVSAGVVAGWTLRSSDNARVQAEATAMVQQLKSQK